MPEFAITVTIRNRPGMADPEGETILRDLVLRGGGSGGASGGIPGGISAIRTAKALEFRVSAGDAAAAEDLVRRVCEEMRIYNPLVSEAVFSAGSN
ncbi:MAG: phosphoribosylformylglycinamidine synthase subunit PurS [Nitrosopumilus sp.]|nr:phosphoribosylformylglycinamidine synthase subunit PurS [Nitrosopumilus sp.]CAI9831180.1 Phosphoribosylformylglycinamidine synthase subunit PurS [Nitrosopumilaceae archaeon]MDA7941603.1 phosphoribosylformylglycinamidine synthase subunit PurS [Nitrosopumilus sp.]MDA7943863.1 phosphoribosylformylglycinamidine synthase subunit PurS [Nitrosopumilus sp.]MDA7945241.1 phosphoribosylformylglycinamidine synthase subunit PurS [Nitrosopumilus sp.]